MNIRFRHALVLSSVLVAVGGLAACSGDQKSDTPSPVVPTAVNPILSGMVGPGCAEYAARVPAGAGSISGMAQDPLATAAANNPMLTQLTAALSGKLDPRVNLTETLNGRPFTVFAPVDDAFKKVPAGRLTTLKTDDKALIRLLTYHVVAGQLAPGQVVGKQMSVAGATLDVTGSGNALKVNGANVICGGVRTANATVYLIDTVLTPPR
jgi:uncharacterized surface protein with fasciclin (FAS1) repeats